MQYKSLIEQGGHILKEADKKRKQIIKESESAKNPDKYISSNLQKLVQETKEQLKVNSTNRLKTIIGQIGKSYEMVNQISLWDKGTSGEKQYYLMLSNHIHSAQDIQEAIDTYKRIISDMPEDDRAKYRRVVDFQIKEFVNRKEPGALYQVEQAIDEFRDDREKQALRDVKIQHEIMKHNKTIDNLMTDELQKLKMSEDLTDFDWLQVADEIEGNSRRTVDGGPPESEVQKQINEMLKNNPYFESDHIAAE